MRKIKNIVSLLVICLILNTVSSQKGNNIYAKFYPEAKKIVSYMTLDQKIGQMSQPDISLINPNGKLNQDDIVQYSLGSLLIGGDGSPNSNGDLQTGNVDYTQATNENWQKLSNRLLSRTVDVKGPQGTFQISVLLGTDAVHGNQHVIGLPLFPHNIGMAATHNLQNFQNEGFWTAQKTLESGFNYVFAPTVAVSHNPQWGRFYETQGTNTSFISDAAQVFVNAAQMYNGTYLRGVLTSTQHFLGDGATLNGNDQGNVRAYNFTTFYENNVQGYRGAIKANTGNVMASYSAINGIPMSINTDLLTGQLREEEGFGGFVISDYDEMGKIAEQGLPTSFIKMTQQRAACMIINSGVDMMMLPAFRTTSITDYFNNMQACLNNGETHLDRVDDAVMRILAVKLAMGLVQLPKASAPISTSQEKAREMLKLQQQSLLSSLLKGGAHNEKNILSEKNGYGISTIQYDVLKAARESLVLLKNDRSVLPISKSSIKYVVLVGDRQVPQNAHSFMVRADFDNIGAQCGGWSVRWQGFQGNQFWEGDLQKQSSATSVLDGVRNVLNGQNVTILYPAYKKPYDSLQVSIDRNAFLAELNSKLPDMNDKNTVIIGITAESPYAEFMGDINSKYCNPTPQEGCLYNNHVNQYYSGPQKTNLTLTYGDFTWQVINKIQGQNAGIPLISVLLSGRPMIVDDFLSKSSAFIAAWWPGTSGGQAIAQATFGDYLFRNGDDRDQRNTLPVDWMGDSTSLIDFPIYETSGAIPQFKSKQWSRGFGISTYKRSLNQNMKITE